MRKLAFGIDIGGINTAIGLVDEQGHICSETGIKTCDFPFVDDFHGDKAANPGYKDGYPAYLRLLCKTMHELSNKVSSEEPFELVGIGIGAPNANYYQGTIETPANLWKFREEDTNRDESRRFFHLTRDISENFNGVKTVMTNDANAAAIGEMIYGGARGMKNFIMITLGTGLGSGFVANGELIYGHDSFAGEFGHVFVEDRRNGRQCGCGLKGCLEAYVSATGIKRTVFELMAKMIVPSKLREIPFNDFDAKMVSDAALEGDPLALEAFRYSGEILGRALADAVTVTSPEAIFLFGGLAKSGPLIFEPTKKYMEENMINAYKGRVKLLPSCIQGKNAAILGSSALVWQELSKH